MSGSNFVDYAKIFICSGKGGAGSIHFKREKFMPKGGPDGGDGGRGGHIIIKGNKNLSTLFHLRYTKYLKASSGEAGLGNNCKGAKGSDIIVEVPLGTIYKDFSTGKLLGEILHDNKKRILLKGGKGGLGNSHFKHALRQTPKFAQKGEFGKELILQVELKVLADVALIGAPNAGKSTLLKSLSAAKPVVGSYPFTTLRPQLGRVSYYDKLFTAVEIPGIIKGAAKGRGLGLRFLKHTLRNRVLLILIPSETVDYLCYYNELLEEMATYDKSILTKKRIIAISKSDLTSVKEIKNRLTTLPANIEKTLFSSLSREGLDNLKRLLSESICI